MFIPPTEDQRICAWFECQTEETLRDLHERFDAVSPRECWTAFFNDCPSPAPESLGDSLAAPVEVVQGVLSYSSHKVSFHLSHHLYHAFLNFKGAGHRQTRKYFRQLRSDAGSVIAFGAAKARA